MLAGSQPVHRVRQHNCCATWLSATHDTEARRDRPRRIALIVPVDPAAAEVDPRVARDPGARAPADTVPRLEDQHPAAGGGELARGDRARPAGADDDRVEYLCHLEWSEVEGAQASSIEHDYVGPSCSPLMTTAAVCRAAAGLPGLDRAGVWISGMNRQGSAILQSATLAGNDVMPLNAERARVGRASTLRRLVICAIMILLAAWKHMTFDLKPTWHTADSGNYVLVD